jgi:hypothetical protein
MPRPPVLDDVRRAEVLALATYGFSRRAIANYVGCAPNTIANTAERDPDFALQLRRSTQHFVCRNIENVQRHAMQSPKSSLWLLERLQPDQFARRSPHSITPAQLNRKFQSWVKALVAAVPPDAQTAVAQAASELAAQHLSNLDDDPPDTDEQADDLPSDDIPSDDIPSDDIPSDDIPSDDIPSDAQPSVGHSSPAAATPAATNPRATGVPPVPRDGATSTPPGATGVPSVPRDGAPSVPPVPGDRATSAPPVTSGPPSPAATSPPAVPLPTPTSALRASATASAAISRATTAALLLLCLLLLGGSAIITVRPGLRPGWAGSSIFVPALHGQCSQDRDGSQDRDDVREHSPAPSRLKAGADVTVSLASARVETEHTPPDVTPLLVKNSSSPLKNAS